VTTPHVVGIGGTTRDGSLTDKALRFALKTCQAEGATTTVFDGAFLETLPHYAPDRFERAEGAIRLIDEIRRADGLIVASPGYHGGVSGLVKNAIDYAEDLRDDPSPYLSGKPVGLIATGAGWQGIVTTIEALRAIVHALRGWPTPLGAAVNSAFSRFDQNGDPSDEKVLSALTTVAEEVMQFVRRHQADLQTTED